MNTLNLITSEGVTWERSKNMHRSVQIATAHLYSTIQDLFNHQEQPGVLDMRASNR